MKFERVFLFIFIVLVLLVTSCGKSDADPSLSIAGSSVIIEDVNWSEINASSVSAEIKSNGSFVADVRIPQIGSRCTGFLISEDHLLTNEHCIERSSDARGIYVYFKHHAGVPQSQWEKVECDEFVGNDLTLDYAIVKCKGSPGKKYGFAKLSNIEPNVGDELYVIHQNCDYESTPGCDFSKKVSKGQVRGLDYEIIHDADTLGGSSGSPVFSSSSNEVIGLHHAGLRDSQGRGVENYAVAMKLVKADIEARFPEIFNGDDGDGNDVPGDWLDIENNNRFSRAVIVNQPLPLGFSGRVSSRRDCDFYKIKVERKGEVKFHLRFSHKEGNLNLKIYNSRKKKLYKSKSRTDDEVIKAYLIPGEYYIYIYGKGRAKAKYSMSVD